MKTNQISRFATIIALSLTLAAAAAQAAVVSAGRFSGTDCSGAGGFANCYAETTGVSQDAPGSPSIYKVNYGSGSFGNPAFGSFLSINGGEFQVSFNTSSHVLSWTYTPGANDPEIHYFTIKQGNSHNLFYDLSSPITSFTIDLDTLGYNSLSHITWFGSGSSATNDRTPGTTGVPAPGLAGLLGAGLAGLGIAALRRRKR